MWPSIRRRLGDHRDDSPTRARQTQLQFTLPNPYGGDPWMTATLAMSSTPATRGATWRIRAHVDRCFHAPAEPGDRAALTHETSRAGLPLARYGRQIAAGVARRAVEAVPRSVVQRLAQQRRRSWLDMQISTSPLDAGAAALMPSALRECYGDKLPRLAVGAPRVGVWAGPAGGPLGGMARLAMVQYDDSDMSSEARERADRFSLNLTIGELIEPASSASDAKT